VPLDDLRSHVLRRSDDGEGPVDAGLLLAPEELCGAHVNEPEVALGGLDKMGRTYVLVDHAILRLDVPVDDVIKVEVLNGKDHRSDVKLSLLRRQQP